MIGDIIDSVRYQIVSRLSSPLWGSLFFSWFALNHKFVWVMFSDLPVESKFALTSLLYNQDLWSFGARWVWWFVYPAISSSLYIFAYPYLSLKLYTYWHTKQHRFKLEKQRIEDDTPLTREEYRSVLIRLRKQEGKFHDLMKDKDQEISELNEILKSKETGVVKYTNTTGEIEEDTIADRAFSNDIVQWNNEYSSKYSGNPIFEKYFSDVISNLLGRSYKPETAAKEYCFKQNLIEMTDTNTSRYTLSEKGKYLATKLD